VVIDVRDDGKGVEPAAAEKIFKPFFSADLVAGESSGLGLAIVRELVSRHGGEVCWKPRPGAGRCSRRACLGPSQVHRPKACNTLSSAPFLKAMASAGHTSWQQKQRMQSRGSMAAPSGLRLTAPAAQMSRHWPQA